MAGGGGSVISAEAFDFLEFWWEKFNIFLHTTFNGSIDGSGLVCWLPEGNLFGVPL